MRERLIIQGVVPPSQVVDLPSRSRPAEPPARRIVSHGPLSAQHRESELRQPGFRQSRAIVGVLWALTAREEGDRVLRGAGSLDASDDLARREVQLHQRVAEPPTLRLVADCRGTPAADQTREAFSSTDREGLDRQQHSQSCEAKSGVWTWLKA